MKFEKVFFGYLEDTHDGPQMVELAPVSDRHKELSCGRCIWWHEFVPADLLPEDWSNPRAGRIKITVEIESADD